MTRRAKPQIADRGDGPLVPSSTSLPEITPKAVLLAIVLAAVLAAANAYLGLFAGMTVSASIPAAVVSMALLRLFRRSNILENNIVQTAASSGEAVAAGIIFTMPALLLIGYWEHFSYWQVTAVALAGGLLGVLYTIPLRRALIVEAGLRFPEGVATAEVLKAGDQIGRSPTAGPIGIRPLLTGTGLAAVVKFAESGLGVWADSLEGATRLGRALVYGGLNLSPALVAVGFIIGLRTAVVVFLGGALAWGVCLPVFSLRLEDPGGSDPLTAARTIWSSEIRYLGIGAMLVGGLWTLLELRGRMFGSLRHLLAGTSPRAAPSAGSGHRTEQDASLSWLLLLFTGAVLLMAFLYYEVVGRLPVALSMTLVMVIAAFLFSSVAAYMAGLVGSSSNPVSGVTIATLMLAALLLAVLLGPEATRGPAAALLIAGVVCCAAAMGGDNLQDLKTGHLVGATPWKQQIMQVVGVVSGALVLAPVLTLLEAKYGFGEASAIHPHPLAAPQANLMAHLAQGIFGGTLAWPLVLLGGGLAVAIILLDWWLERQGGGWRVPVLAVALGLYLPLKLSAAILLGGLVGAVATRAQRTKAGQGGLLLAAGLVTGEALMGIGLALPVAVGSFWPAIPADPFRLFSMPPWGAWPGAAALLLVGWLLYRQGRGSE